MFNMLALYAAFSVFFIQLAICIKLHLMGTTCTSDDTKQANRIGSNLEKSINKMSRMITINILVLIKAGRILDE
jgi:hypothetical protein